MTLPELEVSLALHKRRRDRLQRKIARLRKKPPTLKTAGRIRALQTAHKEQVHLVNRRRRQIHHARDRSDVKPGTLWLPRATRIAGQDCGPFIAAAPKITWHTMEGSSIAGGVAAFRSTGSWPHFSLNPATGELAQHIALNRGARALEHPAGTVETNRAHTIQVELVGFAKDTPHWSPEAYANIARLARDIEAATGVPRTTHVTFAVPAQRQSAADWLGQGGHTGHEHVPNNSHWDPGAYRIHDVI